MYCIEWDGGVGELINTTINRGIILVDMIGSDGQLICIFGEYRHRSIWENTQQCQIDNAHIHKE